MHAVRKNICSMGIYDLETWGEGADVITIAEYVSWKQPDVAEKLRQIIKRALVVSLPFGAWKAIMEERPKPGRAGLLEGEKVV